MNLNAYAYSCIELHRKLNDMKYDGDIDAEYKAFWALYHDALTHTKTLLTYNRYIHDLHDHRVNVMSERKVSNDYRTTFQIDTTVYDTVDNKECGYQSMKFTIVDPTTNDLLFIYWSQGRLQYVVIPNAQLTIDDAEKFKNTLDSMIK
jgi:hypothetical protein